MAVLGAAFGIHIYGFVLRCMIAGRPPVTNMYESVIWVSFGVVLFAIIFELVYKARYYAVAASALATLLLVVADSVPSILDPAIDPLVPVLRSNYWLTIHVLTITLSYAAFALALGVGNFSLGYYIFKPQAKEKVSQLNYFLYRSIQVGVVLLAAGTILGGVWANASWGRFWGWDPKEVWALIALLGYLVILHGRYAGWLRGFGLAVGSILAFLLVLMAWYGVNFILGVGLHSYGFSSGGAKGMAFFVGVELLWVAFAAFRYKMLFKAPAAAAETA
jgi:ABC-type transport system involved in cytochrome c biogenesis permease subunit